MKNVSIGGNVTNSVLVFGNNNNVIKIGDVNGGVVNIIQPSNKPKFSARPAPVMLRPRPFPSLLDRENELGLIQKAVAASAPVSLWGQQGIGKTSFIRQLTHLLDAGNFPSGVIHLNASHLGLEDLLQAVFDSLFESDATYKPTTTEIRHALKDIKALIFLDDLSINQDEVLSLMDAAPGSLFILSAVERSLWGEGEIISLRGLPEAEALKLFEKELSRSLNEQEKEMTAQICTLLQGHPLHILQMAALARETGRPLVSILRDVKNDQVSEKSIATISMANLGNPEKKLLALLAAAGGNILSLEHVKKIFPESDTQKSIDTLLSLGLIQAHSPRISLTGALEASISAMWDLSSWQDILLKYFINWLSQQPAQALVEESTDAIIHSIQKAGEKKQWREVIQLGRALEKFVVLYRRWQTWSEVLNLILKAAKALGDRKVEAWALHQLGSRALYLGYANEAKSFLTQALNLRKAIGDKAGLAITQHNINTLNGIVVTPKNSGCQKYLGCGCGSAVGLAVLATITWIVFRFLFPPYTQVPATIEPAIVDTNTPTQTATKIITNTPTKTLSPTPAPVLLYDFIEHANDFGTVNWYAYYDGDHELQFYPEPQTPSPEIYLESADEYGYVGWQPKTNLMGERIPTKLLLTLPYSADSIYGFYENVFISDPAPDAYLEVKAGYKDLNSNNSDGMVFRIYIDGEEILPEEPVNAAQNKPVIDFAHIPVPNLSVGNHTVKIEVDFLETNTEDWAAWAVIKLWK